jgi:hypothetical protein
MLQVDQVELFRMSNTKTLREMTSQGDYYH